MEPGQVAQAAGMFAVVRSASLADAGSLIRSAMDAPISRKTSSRTVRTSSSLFAKWYEMSPVLAGR